MAKRPSSTPADRLERYRRKRDFSHTPEPSAEGGVPPSGSAPRFVVQRHRARRRHYDLRLEVDGTLVSWAVPKGPTLDPKARVLAVHVEDHPIEYLDFEGVIPRGEYGAGDVIVWDRGTWAPHRTDDPAAAIENGELHFDLFGEKLSGRFVLVRRNKPDGSASDDWLLLHKNDASAIPGWDPEAHPASVKSGRTNDEVAAAPSARWHGDRPAAEAEERLAWDPPSEEELAALDALDQRGKWSLQGRELTLTNLDKVLFAARDTADGNDGRPVAKRDLIRYYAFVAPVMLPFLFDRPLNMHRFPDGVDRPGFWHKEVPTHAPTWITRWRNPEADPGDTELYIVADHPATLAWLANFAAVELHAWTSRCTDPHHPTWALIDIDPGETTPFDDTRLLASLFRTALDHLGVVAGPKVTGLRGIQIWVPITPKYTFDQTRAWVEQVSRAVGATVPDLVSWSWQKKDRAGRARLDYTQNAINKTLVAPFSVRAAPGAPVSVPITWSELDDPDLRPDRLTVFDIPERIETHGNPFASLLGVQQDLPRL